MVTKVFPLVTKVFQLVTMVFLFGHQGFPFSYQCFPIGHQGLPFGPRSTLRTPWSPLGKPKCHMAIWPQLWSSMSSRRLFSRPCGQLAGLCPTCLFHSLRHGCLGLNEVFSFFFHSFIHQGLSPLSFTLATKVSPFRHSGFSFKVLPLVTKDQGSTPPFTLFWSEVWRTKNEERTNLRTGRTYVLSLL